MAWRRSPELSRFRLVADANLTADECAQVGAGAAALACAGYAPFSTPDTELFWAKAYEAERLVAVAPVGRLRRRKATDMLRQPLRKWLGLVLGPLARKTTLLVDTAFMAYDACSPFFTAPGVDRPEVKRAISNFLKRQRRVDTIWISEPPEEATWAATERYAQFHTLPMVQVVVEGCTKLDDYLATLSRNRRRNFRRERETFAKAGGVIDLWEGVIGDNPALHREVMACLEASAAHSQFTVPYNDVLTAPAAIAALRQTVLTARVGGKVVGFMSCLQDGDRLMQCHGGLNYVESHEVKAYHNLISYAIELAIARRCRVLTLGPMTNETKKRAGGRFRPIVSSLWNKLPGDRLVAQKLFIKNFEVYRGALGEPQPEAGDDD
ncbi:MAG TPA: GNAT family N-acetyltransferase [Lacipirellulaceae bacterium]|nr:GNAT family N-acetyltransferase [Lacipirellulaceae bacterium]